MDTAVQNRTCGCDLKGGVKGSLMVRKSERPFLFLEIGIHPSAEPAVTVCDASAHIHQMRKKVCGVPGS